MYSMERFSDLSWQLYHLSILKKTRLEPQGQMGLGETFGVLGEMFGGLVEIFWSGSVWAFSGPRGKF